MTVQVTPLVSGGSPLSPRQRADVLAEVRVAAAILTSGALVGALWALLAPPVVHAADLGENRIAGDGLLALLGLGAGVLSAILLVALPGPRPAVRLAVVLGATTAADILAAVVGVKLGAQALGAPGVALLWPLVTAVLTALRTLAGLIISPNDDEPRASRRHVARGSGDGIGGQ